MVHTDVGGPITPRSREGYRFWIVIVDDFTRFPWVYFMKHKNEALQIYNQWKKDVQTVFQTEIGREDFSESYVKWVRSDRGTEYVNKAFWDQLQHDGTLHETSALYSGSKNCPDVWMFFTKVNNPTHLLTWALTCECMKESPYHRLSMGPRVKSTG
jgi:hypothetical protein